MRRPLPGLFDRLVEKMPRKEIGEIAVRLEVNRKTVYRWHRGAPVSDYNKLRINVLCMDSGIAPLFLV